MDTQGGWLGFFGGLIALFFAVTYEIYRVYLLLLGIVLVGLTVYNILGFLIGNIFKKHFGLFSFSYKRFWKFRCCLSLGPIAIVGLIVFAFLSGGSSKEILYDKYGNEVIIKR